MIKSAAAVLQEVMVKKGGVPDYQCIAQPGPQHMATFQCQCSALGELVSATARSKKEAKQEAARILLQKLANKGHIIPAPYGKYDTNATVSASSNSDAATPAVSSRSYVSLLNELCIEFSLPAPEYELIGDTGPPHLRQFTMKARVGQHTRQATSSTKKTARQMAAEELYTYLRENLKITKDFGEEEALVRAHDRAMERYVEMREDTWRPDLGQKISEYHLGLLTHIDKDKRSTAREAISCATKSLPAEVVLLSTATSLGLEVNYNELDAEGGKLTVVQLTPTTPALAMAGRDKESASAAALSYLELALKPELTS